MSRTTRCQLDLPIFLENDLLLLLLSGFDRTKVSVVKVETSKIISWNLQEQAGCDCICKDKNLNNARQSIRDQLRQNNGF